jgi:hypothetical protein
MSTVQRIARNTMPLILSNILGFVVGFLTCPGNGTTYRVRVASILASGAVGL